MRANAPGLLQRATEWLKAQAIFASRRPLTAIVTLALVYLAWIGVERIVGWALLEATWNAADRTGCNPDGACWAFIVNRLPQFLFGFYPVEARWRAIFPLAAPLVFMTLVALPVFPHGRIVAFGGFCLYPLVAVLLLDGRLLGLEVVSTEMWGGLTLTMLIFTISFVLAFPIAIGLALARTSKMPVFRLLATGFIEFWRGLPLVAILFMSVIMLPLFLPPGVDSPRLLLAMIGITFFASAYLAEVVRGGLNGIDGRRRPSASASGRCKPISSSRKCFGRRCPSSLTRQSHFSRTRPMS